MWKKNRVKRGPVGGEQRWSSSDLAWKAVAQTRTSLPGEEELVAQMEELCIDALLLSELFGRSEKPN